jgi:tRNA 5-methylaminomethyl-2-thiouridine biosynthesis bifunctional protein
MSHPKAELDWTDAGAPRSRRFGDVYFSADDGLAEARAVFLGGCGLPERWAGRAGFCIAELGFGAGLNIAAALELWGRTRAAGARLHLFSVEAHPLTRGEAARALAAWPQLGEAAQALIAAWPRPMRGFQRLDLPQFAATLDVAVMDVAEALAAWSGRADAWFLDGFSPALNPEMWRPQVLDLVAGRSNLGARAATFTVAGAVRRGLQAAGFTVEKKPGHGRKRERLEAQLSGHPPARPEPGTAAIVGAGIAGAALARALREEGIQPVVIADDGIAASGNPAALVTPGLDASGRGPARLYAQTFARAIDLYSREPVIISEGVRRRPRQPRDRGRFEKIAGQDLFAPGALSLSGEGELVIAEGLVIEPAPLLARWRGEAFSEMRVSAISPLPNGWRIESDLGDMEAELVFLAAGWGAADLARLPLRPVRGQASYVETQIRPDALVDGDYLIPTRNGFLFGATHDRGRTDTEVLEADHDRNLAALARLAPGLAAPTPMGRAAIRAASPDHMPIAGRLGEGLFVLTGLGSRGFTTAPLLAEHLVGLALGLPSPLPADLARLVDPARFGADRRPD